MVPEFQFVSKDSARLGQCCCPRCGSIDLIKRQRHYYCRRCKHTFKTPAKVKPTSTRKKRVSKSKAGPALYRGLRWEVSSEVTL